MTDEQSPRPAPGNRRESARLVAAVILLALLIAFVIDNTRYVTVGFVFANHRTRLIYVLVVTAALGVVLDRLWQRARRNH